MSYINYILPFSVPSKIFVSWLVSKKCRQDKKKNLGALCKFSYNASIFTEKNFHQPFLVNDLEK